MIKAAYAQERLVRKGQSELLGGGKAAKKWGGETLATKLDCKVCNGDGNGDGEVCDQN